MGVLAVATLQAASGIDEDAVTNSFAIGGVDSSMTSAECLAICGDLVDFYNIPNPSTPAVSLAQLLSPALDRSTDVNTIKLYDITGHLDGSPHGSPFYTHAWDLAPTGSTAGLPNEIALCLQLEAFMRADQQVEVPDGVDPGSAVDRPRQRYTGRLFLGPWADSSQVHSSATRPEMRPHGDLRYTMVYAFQRLTTDINTSVPAAFLGVWSRADRRIREITHVSADDAWDVQRRRGSAPTFKDRITLTGGGSSVEMP